MELAVVDEVGFPGHCPPGPPLATIGRVAVGHAVVVVVAVTVVVAVVTGAATMDVPPMVPPVTVVNEVTVVMRETVTVMVALLVWVLMSRSREQNLPASSSRCIMSRIKFNTLQSMGRG